ncbi:MAG: hypothetical protein CM15mP18_0910 [Methanobacteriota archaeon]|nr:MAG: hypothetical protein CM15mP18_0910 [Euryarchaeota archaeon]
MFVTLTIFLAPSSGRHVPWAAPWGGGFGCTVSDAPAGATPKIVTVTIPTIPFGVASITAFTSRNGIASHGTKVHRTTQRCTPWAAPVARVWAVLGASDIAGFGVIATSPMGLFRAFGTFSATNCALPDRQPLLYKAGPGLFHGPNREFGAERLKRKATAPKASGRGDPPGRR